MTIPAAPIDWASVPSTEPLPGITRQRVDGARATIIRYVYQPGAIFPTHQHPEEQTTIVLTGEIEFWLGDEHSRVLARAGDTLLVPADLPHGARVVGSAVVESINVLAPVRQTDVAFVPSAYT